MMHPSEDHISQLIMEKILGMIALEDDIFLQQLLTDNPEIKLQYEETLRQMEQARSSNIQPPEAETGWQQLDAAIATRKKLRYKSIIRSVAAVIVFLLLIGGTAFFVENIHHRNNVVTVSRKGLQLQLATGKTIALSDAQSGISVGDVTLNNDSSKRILHYLPTGKVDKDVKMNTLSVPPGMDYTIELSDGTTVTLNSATQLKFPFAFTGNTREISIDGEAYLKVAHNAAKPFIVHLPTGTVKVLGTQFNIDTYDKNSVKVSLVEGSLRFSSDKDSLLLVPGKEGILKNQAIQEQDINEDDLAWINGEYIMSNTSINDIALLIPRWFGVQVVLDNQNISDKKFSGIIYKNKPLNNFLEMLKGTTDADYYYAGNVLHLK